MLNISGLTKNFKDFKVLDDVNIEAHAGQIYGLVGSNGCGKTTLLKHIINIYTPDEGEIFYDDAKINEHSEFIDNFYYVQDDLYFPYSYTLETLFQYESLFYPDMSREKFDKLLIFFGMDRNKKLKHMSKGQKKQAAFIVAIAARPKVLLLDEIVDGLDAVVRRKFWNVLIDEVLEENILVIISSHALKELDNICDKVGIMHEGKVIKEEEMDTLKADTKRVQFAVHNDFNGLEDEAFKVLRTQKIGSVYFMVIKGSVEKFRDLLESNYKVLLFDELPMNLEEIFVTELGGVGYGIEEYNS